MICIIGALKVISFFHVVNDVNDFLHIIKKNNLSINDREECFRESQISEEVIFKIY